MVKVASKIKALRLSLGGIRQHELAKRIGVEQPTVSKWERERDFPKYENAKQLAALAGGKPEDFMSNDGSDSLMPIPSTGRSLPVLGFVQAGEWSESQEWPTEDAYHVSAHLPEKWNSVPLFALEVRGDSYNREFPDESIVYVAPLAWIPGGPRSGQTVVAQRRDQDGTHETTLKRFVIEDGKKWLWPHSTSPEHQAPLQFTGGSKKTAEVRIIGVVVGGVVMSDAARDIMPGRR